MIWAYFSALRRRTVLDFHSDDFAQLHHEAIKNSYLSKVKLRKHSKVLPLGAKAQLVFDDADVRNLPRGEYELVLTDISELIWQENIDLE